MKADEFRALRGTITILVHQLQRGNRDVMQQLFETYFSRLEELGRVCLPPGTRRVADEGDLAIEVLTRFLLAAADGKLPEIRGREDVWRLLSKRLRFRAINQSRDTSREKQQILTASAGFWSGSAGTTESASPGVATATPLEQLILAEDLERLAELHEQLLGCLENPTMKRIAELVLEGTSPEAIVRDVKLSRATVYRKLSLIKDCWRSLAKSHE
ncbi:MAG: helix-turn-helix domain-containing protein [Planctomycetes bacterium]|nr:helix-turn-helix domain-containing protein [Planctomycetota bacterium]